MPPHHDQLQPRALAILGAATVGIALAAALMPAIYSAIPSDLSRGGTIIRALRTEKPRVVVFGDSRAEAAIDAALLSPDALNLAAPDQTLPEILLLSDELPATVRTVIVFVTPEEAHDSRALPAPVANAAWMFGLRPSPETRGELERCTGPAPFESPLHARFAGRWILRQALNTLLRDVLRPSLLLRRERTDLKFPSIYSSALPPERFEDDINQIRMLEAGAMHPSRQCLLESLNLTLRPKNARLLLVVPPIHSAAIPRYYETFTDSMTDFARSRGMTMIDLTHEMPDDGFADARHLTWAGARVFTRVLRESIDEGERAR